MKNVVQKSNFKLNDLCKCDHFFSLHPALKRFSKNSPIPYGYFCESCDCKKFEFAKNTADQDA